MGTKRKRRVVKIDVVRAGHFGGLATARNRTPAQRKRIARKAIRARWNKYYRDHPEKLPMRRKAVRKAKSAKERTGTHSSAWVAAQKRMRFGEVV